MTTPSTEPRPEVVEPVIPSKGYALVPHYVPRDDEDEWLRLHGDWDEGVDCD